MVFLLSYQQLDDGLLFNRDLYLRNSLMDRKSHHSVVYTFPETHLLILIYSKIKGRGDFLDNLYIFIKVYFTSFKVVSHILNNRTDIS